MPSDEKILQTSHGWSDWSGGNPPIRDWQTLVDIQQRSKEILTSVKVGAYRWDWTYGKYNAWDIIRFRLVTDEDTLKRKEAAESNKSEGLKGREKAALEFQHELSEIFADGPPDSSFGDSAFDNSSSAASSQRSTKSSSPTHKNPDRPMKQGLGVKVGCWPGQFMGKNWRKGT